MAGHGGTFNTLTCWFGEWVFPQAGLDLDRLFLFFGWGLACSGCFGCGYEMFTMYGVGLIVRVFGLGFVGFGVEEGAGIRRECIPPV